MNKKSIREAILRAADSIEREPKRYSYKSNAGPGCGAPLCMTGWIGFHLSVPVTNDSYMYRVKVVTGFDYIDIEKWRLSQNATMPSEQYLRLQSYQSVASVAAELLRLYADHKFPAAPIAPAIPLSTWDAIAADTGWSPVKAGAERGAA